MTFKTPIIFLVYNRPDLTQRVFEKIRSVKPAQLLIVADGAKDSKDKVLCEATREVVARIDWPCEVHRNFADKNLGCKERVSTGINWAFSIVEEAIVLEDDCVPAIDFFTFCEALLDRYRNDPSVMMISGDNFQDGRLRGSGSYYFSRYAHVWGWATWKRAWDLYDVKMQDWPELRKSGWLRTIFEDPLEQAFWDELFEMVYSGYVNTWDYQWVYAMFRKNGFSVMPNVNLISNIGFGESATHTTEESNFSNLPHGELKTLKHSDVVEISKEADRYTFEHVFGGTKKRHSSNIFSRARRMIKRIVGFNRVYP